MPSRYRVLAVYAGLLAFGTSYWLIAGLETIERFPSPWLVLVCIAAALFIWQFGLRAPRVGLISMERLPQIGLLLVFEPPVAAAICAAASFSWPLINRAYSHGSIRVALLRAIHNASMTALMLLAAGEAYLQVGGHHPLDALSLRDIGPLTVMALVAQTVNIALMTLFFHFDGRDVRRIVTPIYALSDLLFVPAGVLAAVLYNAMSMPIFVLFAALMIVFVLSFNSIGQLHSGAPSERSPLARLFEAGRALQGARRMDELGTRILTETHALVPFDEFYLVLVDRDERVLDVRVHERRGERLERRTKPLDAGLFGWVVERAKPVLIENLQHAPADLLERAEATDKETGSLIAVPLVQEGAVIGLLSVQDTRAGVYSDADLHLVQQLAGQVAAAVAAALVFEDLEDYRQHLERRVAERTAELEKTNGDKERLIAVMRERSQTLERESQEDPLTGVANRRAFTQRLSAEIEVALAVNQPLTIAIADLDHFKFVNDRLGHTTGDAALRESAAIMRNHCRDTDLVARIGGEEFALILPGMSLQPAADFCERLRHAIEAHPWHKVHADLQVTVSIGLWQWDGTTAMADLLQAADNQLYRAKLEGRNRVA
jgi:diguanylate cyclase (GGDEF)-like protein